MAKIRKGDSPRAYWVPMVRSAVRILETFDDSESELSLHEVSSIAQVSKTSAFRILYTLGKLGYVERNLSTGKYELGPKIVGGGPKALSGINQARIVRPFLQELRDRFNETVNLAVLRKYEIIYVQILESTLPFRMVGNVGSVVPLHSTALGKAIAAFLPEGTVKSLLKRCKFERFTPHTISSRSRFQKALAKVRERGFSLDEEETTLGATCVGFPILNADNIALGGVSISGPSPRIRDQQKQIVQALKKISEAISTSLSLVMPVESAAFPKTR